MNARLSVGFIQRLRTGSRVAARGWSKSRPRQYRLREKAGRAARDRRSNSRPQMTRRHNRMSCRYRCLQTHGGRPTKFRAAPCICAPSTVSTCFLTMLKYPHPTHRSFVASKLPDLQPRARLRRAPVSRAQCAAGHDSPGTPTGNPRAPRSRDAHTQKGMRPTADFGQDAAPASTRASCATAHAAGVDSENRLNGGSLPTRIRSRRKAASPAPRRGPS